MTDANGRLGRRGVLAGIAGLTAGAATTGRTVADVDADEAGEDLRVGAGEATMAWRAGAKPGQVGTDPGTSLDREPYPYNTIAEPGDGIHSEPTATAIVLESGGERYALVKADSFLVHENIHRRVADLTESLGIDRERLIVSSTHNHSAPHNTSTGLAVGTFTDLFDARHWSYQTRQLAAAVERAVDSLESAEVRAVEASFDDVQENIVGPDEATEKATEDRLPLDLGNTDDYDTLTDEDGDPIRAGFPRDHFEDQFVVVRFDTPDGDPIAATLTLGLHPESLAGGHGLTSAEFVGVLERRLEAHVGGDFQAAFLNGALGDVEPSRGNVGQPDWWRESFARMEELSDRLADEGIRLYELAGSATVPDERGPDGTPADPPASPPGNGDPPVGGEDLPERTAGPHTPPEADGETVLAYGPDVDVDAAALRLPSPADRPGPAVSYLSQEVGSGLEVPSTGLAQESSSPFLTALSIGDVLLATFPGEPISDVSFNFRTRVVDGFDDVYQGYHWSENPDWVRERIADNFAETTLEDGYEIAALLSIANTWAGYFVTPWEYENRNHYRESLTPYGPDSAPYVTDALIDLAGELRGEGGASSSLSVDETIDRARREAVYRSLVVAEQTTVQSFRAAIPPAGDVVGEAREQPNDVERFETAAFTWVGGSNAVDLPRVALERREDGEWQTVATGDGHELLVLTEHPQLYEEPTERSPREREWRVAWEVPWDAPPGEYRFLVTGVARDEPGRSEKTFFDPHGANDWYAVASDPFSVATGSIPFSDRYTTLEAGDRLTGTLAFESTYRAVERPADGTEIEVAIEGAEPATATAAYDTDGFALEVAVSSPPEAVVVERGAFVDSAGNPNERVRHSLEDD